MKTFVPPKVVVRRTRSPAKAISRRLLLTTARSQVSTQSPRPNHYDDAKTVAQSRNTVQYVVGQAMNDALSVRSYLSPLWRGMRPKDH
jgi:hypothetical protein